MSNPAQPKLPESKDLISQIHFASEDGKIWFNEQRMLLIHSAVMGSLRKELIETLGVERTRGFLMRFGYYSRSERCRNGTQDPPGLHHTQEAFLAGPQLHNIKGMVRVVPKELRFDIESGSFHGEFDWYDFLRVRSPSGRVWPFR